jgi:WD40 repeat protein
MKGSSQPVVTPGKSGQSRLIEMVTLTNSERRMPPGDKPLSAQDVELLRRWIDGGAREGQSPEQRVSGHKAARKLDVIVATPVIPPAEAFAGLAAGPLALSLRVGPLSPATAVAFSPDGTLLACGSQGLVALWDMRMGQVVRALTDLPGAVHSIGFSPDGTLLAIGGGLPAVRGSVRLYNTADGNLAAVLSGHRDVVAAVVFSPDGKRLASAGFDSTVRIWDWQKRTTEQTLSGHSDVVQALSFGPEGRWLASAAKDRTARLTETATGKHMLSLNALDELQAVAVSPDGQWVVAGGGDATLTWWRAGTGERVRVRGAHHGPVTDLCFSRDGTVLASAGADKTVRFWDPATGNEKHAVVVPSLVYSVALSPDGGRAAAACFDGRVRVYEVAGTKPVLTLMALAAEKGAAHWLAQTPQGHMIGSPKLLIDGKWTMGGKVVPSDPVWKALFSPEAVASAARGEPHPGPTFGR